jgi:hypothetical protein
MYKYYYDVENWLKFQKNQNITRQLEALQQLFTVFRSQ